MHGGYKGKNPQPWKKAKTLKFNDQNEAKAEGALSYPKYRRAVWYAADLAQPGQLDVKLEITPPAEASDEFDLGFEVLDPDFRVIARSDLTEGDAGDLNKSKSLKDLEPGKYYIHLYLQQRLDTADYSLRATFQPMASVGKSDFPAQVAFVPTLPMVPLQDDTPSVYTSKRPATTTNGRRPPRGPTPPKPDTKPATEIRGSILGVSVVKGGTEITISVGLNAGAANGMKGKVVGLRSGDFQLSSCNERSCTATVPVTPDQIKASSAVVLTP